MNTTEQLEAVRLALEILREYRAGVLERHHAKALLIALPINVSLNDPEAPRVA